MATPEPTMLDSGGGALGPLLRAALPSLPVLGRLPGIRKAAPAGFTGLAVARPPVSIERAHVAAYAAVCGFPEKDTVPLTYPHLWAFGLHLAMMTDPAFPAPAIGTVHLENTLVSHRPIGIGETLSVGATVGPGQPHPRGTTYRFSTTVTAAGTDAPLWESVSTYLRRGRGDETATSGTVLPDALVGGTTWRLAGDLGRRYAAVSGDHNPIHLHPLSAKALGFPRQIAHGMWSKARCLAAIENRLPDAVRVEVGFRRPILLPGSVVFATRPTDEGHVFSVTHPGTGSTHLVGRATSL
ncbi:MAG: hypothetical protein LH468_02875 [Nocardioides sp.]|nr:hypothetical protein [Nocardioides sp.]